MKTTKLIFLFLLLFFYSSILFSQNDSIPKWVSLIKNNETKNVYNIYSEYIKYTNNKNYEKDIEKWKPYLRWLEFWIEYANEDGTLPDMEKQRNEYLKAEIKIGGMFTNDYHFWEKGYFEHTKSHNLFKLII